MEDVLVNGLLAAAETFRDLLVNVTGKLGDVFGGLETASQGSSQKIQGSSEAAHGLYEIIDEIG